MSTPAAGTLPAPFAFEATAEVETLRRLLHGQPPLPEDEPNREAMAARIGPPRRRAHEKLGITRETWRAMRAAAQADPTLAPLVQGMREVD